MSAGSVRPPAWFRYGVVAALTLMLCSCRVADPSLGTAIQTENPGPPDEIKSAIELIQDRQVIKTAHQEPLPTEPPEVGDVVSDSNVVTALYTAEADYADQKAIPQTPNKGAPKPQPESPPKLDPQIKLTTLRASGSLSELPASSSVVPASYHGTLRVRSGVRWHRAL